MRKRLPPVCAVAPADPRRPAEASADAPAAGGSDHAACNRATPPSVALRSSRREGLQHERRRPAPRDRERAGAAGSHQMRQSSRRRRHCCSCAWLTVELTDPSAAPECCISPAEGQPLPRRSASLVAFQTGSDGRRRADSRFLGFASWKPSKRRVTAAGHLVSQIAQEHHSRLRRPTRLLSRDGGSGRACWGPPRRRVRS
jgi:hypothetical protein